MNIEVIGTVCKNALIKKTFKITFMIKYKEANRISCVMVSVHASSAVDRGFEPLPGQTKRL